MLLPTLHEVFNRDRGRLRREMESYNTEAGIWKVEPGIANSGGNLCLHLIGNLNTYLGKELRKTGYI
ncbi:MAG TPA: hypothetical protein VG870_13515 [Chitinophagaceae bacterium]|nr:hypothetical protein [Chitinophagaceae bacterium]